MTPHQRRVESCGKYGDDFSHGHLKKMLGRLDNLEATSDFIPQDVEIRDIDGAFVHFN